MTELVSIVPALFVLALAGVLTARFPAGRVLIYGGSLVLCAGLLLAGFGVLSSPVQHMRLPLGLPWIGTNLRLDACRPSRHGHRRRHPGCRAYRRRI